MNHRPILALIAALAVAAAPHAQILVHGALARDHSARPGETYDEVISVHNPTDEVQQARLYLTDYQFSADGQNRYDAPGTGARSNAGWVAFAPPLLTLPPGETVAVTVTVRVPSGIVDGSYWSILMVEGIPRGSAESTLGDAAEGEIQFGIVERVRYGVQIASHVGAAAARVEVVAAGIEAGEDGGKVLVVDVENVSDRMLDGPVYLDVFDAEGTAHGRIEGTAARVYPGTSFRHRVNLAELAPGTYQALLVVDGGEAGVFGAQYTLDL